MAEEITNAELARRLDDRFDGLREDLQEVKATIRGLVPREVYEAQRVAADQQVDNLRTRVTALESRGRWLIGAVFVPILTVALAAFLAYKGVGP